MFARYFVELRMPFDTVRAALTRAPAEWMPGLAREADDAGRALLTEVGFGSPERIGRTVAIRFGEPITIPSKTILPLHWEDHRAGGLFPSLDADLEAAPIGPARTQLAISARYRPPLGALGRMIDRAVLHRVAEATLKDFVDRIAEALRAGVAA
ncbi:MAG TPA: hypothetical protein VK646_00185 [Actinomycetota bacterium]|nr:hypothetical protein [Actinomycetota bacterium]